MSNSSQIENSSKMLKIFLTIILYFTIKVLANIRVIPDDRVQYCHSDEKLREGEIAYGNITDIDLNYVLIDENTIVINGTMTFKIDIEQPTFSTLFSGEQFEGTDWHKRLDHLIRDNCEDLFSPTSMYYPYSKDLKKCPFKPGVSFNSSKFSE